MKVPVSVLHVGKFYPPAPGGMERIVELLCEATSPQGIESRVLVANTSARTARELKHGVHVTRAGSLAQIGSVGVCPTFPLELARAARDVTVIHEPNPLALVSDWVAAQHGPLIVWFHSEVMRPRWKYRLLYRPFLRRVLERADRIVVSSPRLADFSAELRDFRGKCVVIPFGITTDRLRLTTAVHQRAEAVRRSFPGPLVLFVGRLVRYKGIDVLVRAMKSVNATALIVGAGPLDADLRREAERSGLKDRVKFLGALSDDDVVAHLQGCDVFALPSVSSAETFGVAQLEAMACGKPVVSTDLRTGVPWVNRHGETGLIVPPGDAEALALALSTLLADGGLRQRLGEAARRRVEADFTVDAMRTKAAALYGEVLVERAALRDRLGAVQSAPAGTDVSRP
jgi:rhamnosyl/mannosyltransferase